MRERAVAGVHPKHAEDRGAVSGKYEIVLVRACAIKPWNYLAALYFA